MNKLDVGWQDNFEQCCAFDLWARGYRYKAAALILPIRADFFVFQDFLLWQGTR